MDDVLVIGGGYAGLAAALQLARARRHVTVLDTNRPRNRFAKSAHGVVGFDGASPWEIRDAGRRDLHAYPTARIVEAEATAARVVDGGFVVTSSSGAQFEARRLVLAYGVADALSDLAGFAECWGNTVLHCPYCHGYEVAGLRLGLLYSTPMSLHGAGLIRDWSDDLILFLNGNEVPDAEREKLDKRGVRLVDGEVTAIEHEEGLVRGIRLSSGEVVPLDALFAHPQTAPSCSVHESLGVDMVESPAGSYIAVDESQETNVKGVYAAGDLAQARTTVTFALAGGALAGVMAHQSLVTEGA